MKFLRKPTLILSILILTGAAYILGWSKIFVVEKVVIDSKDKKIVQDVLTKINQPPAVVSIGQPLARVDRRQIATRMRELLWVENIKLDRRLISGELHITIIPRNPLGQLTPKDSTNVESVGFMDQELDFFYLPRDTVAKAISSGEWEQVPEITFQDSSRAVREDVAGLLESLQASGLKVERIVARDQLSIKSQLKFNQKRVDVSWGSVKELPLKIEIFNRLMELKANKSVTKLDLSNPISPIVGR